MATRKRFASELVLFLCLMLSGFLIGFSNAVRADLKVP